MTHTSAITGYQHEEAWDDGWLRVDHVHEVYYQQYGKKNGKPALFLHGGPGAQCSKDDTSYFNPEEYRVILLDQRGCGKSRPKATLLNNTTWHLVSDIEALRRYLHISKWYVVFGGSWGSALALAYAQTHPSCVGSLILRGVFTVRDLELQWTNGGAGAAILFPDKYENFVSPLSDEERTNTITSFHKRLMSEDTSTSHAAARAWIGWGSAISTLLPDETDDLGDPDDLLADARMETHYFMNKAWLEEGQLLKKENLDRIKDITVTIVQGRYDLICPPLTAWELHKACTGSRLYWANDAGHSASEPSIKKKLVDVCDEHAQLNVS